MKNSQGRVTPAAKGRAVLLTVVEAALQVRLRFKMVSPLVVSRL